MSDNIPLDQFIQPSDLGILPPNQVDDQSESLSSSDALNDGIELLKLWEGLELSAYPDPATNGPPITIGYGCTQYENGAPIKMGDTITEAQAESMLRNLIERDYLPSLREIPYWDEMSARQKGALLCYSWNMGPGFVGDIANFRTINTVLANRDWSAVRNALMLYTKANGQVMLGLKRRRHSEACLWEGQSAHDAYAAGTSLNA